MSDLQVSLLIIGVIVVGGVTAFNWFQQWRLRRKLEHAFGDKHEDVLLREDPLREQSARLEPQIGTPQRAEAATDVVLAPQTSSALPERGAPAPGTLPPVPGFDPAIDY